MILVKQLLADVPTAQADEIFETLVSTPGCRLERIVSYGQVSPPGYWYDQEWPEWVLLMSGAAQLIFEEEPEPLDLTAGDAVLIRAHQKHRVAWTDPKQPSIWLALHFAPG